MIDLTRTEQQMFDEIKHAPEEAEFVLRGATPDELLPTLMETYSRRYASVPAERVFAELNYLVKKGLGNAYKWGNGGDPNRSLTVRSVMTDLGAVVVITDEGAGFDVANVLGRFLQRADYARHGGSGFFHFHEARSVVSYADGGRTLLIRFLCAAGEATQGPVVPVSATQPRARRHADLAQLKKGAQVKVKGGMRPDGRFVAEKISLKPVEELGVIDATIRDVSSAKRGIRVVNSMVTIPENVEITSPEQRRLGFDALHVGQTVELIGRYTHQHGFLPVKIQIRSESSPEFEEVQGIVDGVSEADASFQVLGIAVATDERTQIKDKRA